MKNQSDQYLKIVEWSEEDNCYIGTSPGLFMGGVHGDDQTKVFLELCDAVEEVVALFESEGKSLPVPTANKNYSGKISLRIPPELHKTVAIKATQSGESVNKFIRNKLEASV
ncbi:MAG: toxin-antitoxin system HicB family antitoxin [Chloroflexi bacterium]|nr:toxin-antitoxin system HicB family antitoxin [Chloroflexota bacterium]